jgi:hypothetical protein
MGHRTIGIFSSGVERVELNAAHSTISILSSAAINFQHVIPRPEILLAERLSATRDHGPTASTR